MPAVLFQWRCLPMCVGCRMLPHVVRLCVCLLDRSIAIRVRPWEINHRFIHPVSPQAKSILLLGKSILNCPARGGFLAGGCVLLPIWAIFGLKLGPQTPPKGPHKWARNMPPKDRIWVTKRRRSRVSDRLGTNPAGIRMFRVAANGSWRGLLIASVHI